MEDYNPKFMEMAIELARQNVTSAKGGPFGAVVVKDGEVIATAMNEVVANDDPTAHAEVMAIRRACSKLHNYQLVVCEIYTSCEPCPMCLGAIYWARPDKVYYAATRHDAANSGFDDSLIYQECKEPLHNRTIPFYNIMRKEALEAFKAWDKSGLKIKY